MVEFTRLRWLVFAVALGAMLAIDLFAHRGDRTDTKRSAWTWAVLWILAGLGFCAYVATQFGGHTALSFLGAYLIEEALSVDNLFVFLLLFRALKVPIRYQRTVLSWGIFGALVFRGLFIFPLAQAVKRWDWVLYIFGVLLLYAAYKVFREDPDEEEEEGPSAVVQWLSKKLPISADFHGHKFLVRQGRKLLATPLFLAVLALEITDVMFAIDSVPAAFSVTHQTFVVYTSNAFAILGLRSMYVVIAHAMSGLRYLNIGLGAVLTFASLKILLARWIDVPPLWSVAVIVVCIGAAIIASLAHARRHGPSEGTSDSGL